MVTDLRQLGGPHRRDAAGDRRATWRQPPWSDAPRPAVERLFEIALLGVLAGYLMFNRGFAWLHIPGTPLFLGEMVLALGMGVLATTRVRVDDLVRTATPVILLVVFTMWCTLRSLAGVQTYGIDAVRDLAIAYYGAFAVFTAVLLAGRRDRLEHWLDQYGRILPVAMLWLGPAVLLSEIYGEGPPFVPDSAVSIFSHKSHSAALHAMIALLYLWLLTRRADLPFRRRRAALTFLSVGVLGISVLLNRGALLSVVAGLGVLWLLEQRRAGAIVARVATIGLAAMVIAYAFDLRVPAVSSGGRDLSAQQFVANIVSLVDPSAVDQDLSGTADWRLQYWRRLVADVTRDHPLVGYGFGPNLRERFGEQDEEVPARDAHNSHIGIYARSGLIGLVLWTATWWTWFAHVLRTRRVARRRGDVATGNLAGALIAANVAMLVNAFFDPALEGPQTAIWVWTLFGVGITLRPRRPDALDDGSHDMAPLPRSLDAGWSVR